MVKNGKEKNFKIKTLKDSGVFGNMSNVDLNLSKLIYRRKFTRKEGGLPFS